MKHTPIPLCRAYSDFSKEPWYPMLLKSVKRELIVIPKVKSCNVFTKDVAKSLKKV